MKVSLFAVAVVGLSFSVTAAALPENEAQEPVDWRLQAKEIGLNETAVAQLERDRILVADTAYKQIFTPYLDEGPLFITSDSLLNAYHVLYEESIFQQECGAAASLPDFLREMLSNMDAAGSNVTGNPEMLEKARTRAKLVAGIALRLMDDGFRFEDPELDEILDEETAQIVAAAGIRRPAWLGPFSGSFKGIDCNRYKPRGFYTRRESLSRYFRAVSWLHSIPFRINRDEEFLGMLLLGESLDGWDGSCNFRSDMFSALDNLDVFFVSDHLQDESNVDLSANGLRAIQEKTLEYIPQTECGMINDSEPGFRILSAFQTSSAILFQKTTDERSRPLPSGLDVAVAMGSELAKQHLNAPDLDALLAQIEESADLFQGYRLFGPRRYFVSGRLYKAYLYALKALVDEAEPDAPDLMHTTAWQAKSLNTLLASWAQFRHTWSLQAKQCVLLTCAGPKPAGFVEPDPEFYSRMADLARATSIALSSPDAQEARDLLAVENLRYFLHVCGSMKTVDEMNNYVCSLSFDEQTRLMLGAMLLDDVFPSDNRGSQEHYAAGLAWLQQVIIDIGSGHMDRHPGVKESVDQLDGNLPERWDELEKMCNRLESLAHKQLRGVAFSPEEEQLIASYGKSLAELMFYSAESYVFPRDDAPRIVDVYTHVDESGRKNLEVGVARARQLLVLYPWQGQTVLCRGAVMPYYEVTSPSRLNDAEWKSLLDSEKRPAVPAWFAPIVEGNALTVPEIETN